MSRVMRDFCHQRSTGKPPRAQVVKCRPSTFASFAEDATASEMLQQYQVVLAAWISDALIGFRAPNNGESNGKANRK